MVEKEVRTPLLSPRMARINLKTGAYNSEMYGIKSKKKASNAVILQV